MSLLEYCRSSATSLEQKTIDQIVAFAGEGGKLTDNGFMVYGFVDKDFAVAIPFQVIEGYRNQMQSTPSKGNRSEYWHVSIRENDGSVNLNLPKSRVSVSLDDYKFDIS